MTTIESRTSPDRMLATDGDLFDLLEVLLGTAHRRQLWLIMLDDANRIEGPLMPLEGHPQHPEDLCDTDDLGEVAHSFALAHRFAMISDLVGATQVILVWERPGGEDLEAEERAWAGAMTRRCDESGVRLRAQFVLHDRGLRLLVPDDHR